LRIGKEASGQKCDGRQQNRLKGFEKRHLADLRIRFKVLKEGTGQNTEKRHKKGKRNKKKKCYEEQ